MSSIALPRPVEKVAIVTMLLVFLCGGVTGAVVMSYWFHPIVSGSHNPSRGVVFSVDELQTQLDLSPEQTRQLKSVLDDFSHYYDNVLSFGNSRILQILNTEQKLKYEKLMREHKPQLTK